jgi:flagellar transcriptional activator FlhD
MTTHMPGDTTFQEICDINRSWLRLAQRLLSHDIDKGRETLGMSRDAAEMLLRLTAEQIVRLTASNQLLCRINLNDVVLLKALRDKGLATTEQQHSEVAGAQTERD